jgi:hypothetical protein
VVSTRKEANPVLVDLIDQPMLVVDSSRPTALQIMLQRLGLSHSLEGISLNFSNQPDNSQRLRSVMLHPPREILERRCVKF